MRLLIAGWQGQIAQALVEGIAARADVRACALGRPAFNICEVRSIERALSDIRPNVVINAAAYTDVDKAETEPEKVFELNRDGARLLAQAAASRGVPVIHISTDYVFDGTKSTPYVETDAANPTTVYGRSKLAGEAAVEASNAQHIILRTAWIYSPFGRNFVKSILQRARDGEALRVVTDQSGSPTYAPHLVSVMLSIAARLSRPEHGPPVPWGVYHAAGNGGASWYEVAREILGTLPEAAASIARLEATSSTEFPAKAPRPAYSVLDTSKLQLGFDLALPDWQAGVAACVGRLQAR